MLMNIVMLLVVWCMLVCGEEAPAAESRIYDMTKCAGAGCPYTASWLAHVNLFRKLTWYLDSTKMEAASFVIFDKAKLKFQIADPDAYYVHHMSMYEHLNHKKYGFEVANNKTVRLSESAFNGECNTLQVSKSKEYMALIPFYGGLPPGVTADLKVGSIGQGNSLVGPTTKAMMAMASICSCLKYFGHVTVGVARLEDRILINEMIGKLSSQARHHINVIHLKMNKPAHLPFHLLNWGQHYVKRHNCQQFYLSNKNTSSVATSVSASKVRRRLDDTVVDASGVRPNRAGGGGGKRRSMHFSAQGSEDHEEVDVSLIPAGREEYEICYPNAVAKAVGTAINVTYSKKNEASFAGGIGVVTAGSNSSSVGASAARKQSHFVPIKYIYFSECDQVVRFDSEMTLLALTAASNDTTFFTGRRREKAVDSDPEAYMSNLDNWRNCGAPGYSLHWPKDIHVHFTSQAKKLILVRHGLTEMNELTHGKWGTPEFVDAKLWDTKLSPTGIQQTQQLNALMKDYKGVSINTSEIQLLVSSPLHRALHTAELVFKDKLPSNVTRIAHPLFRERVYMSSEIGQQKHVISALHPEWNYDHVPEGENWWYEHKTDEDRKSYVEWRPKDGQYSVPGEPRDVFRSRVLEARQWLLARPETCIAVVAHRVILRALTGRGFDNCEAAVLSSEELLDEPYIV